MAPWGVPVPIWACGALPRLDGLADGGETRRLIELVGVKAFWNPAD